jgi:hypothetical protein
MTENSKGRGTDWQRKAEHWKRVADDNAFSKRLLLEVQEERDTARAVAARAMACLRHCGCDICRAELKAMDDALRGIPSPLFPTAGGT